MSQNKRDKGFVPATKGNKHDNKGTFPEKVWKSIKGGLLSLELHILKHCQGKMGSERGAPKHEKSQLTHASRFRSQDEQ